MDMLKETERYEALLESHTVGRDPVRHRQGKRSAGFRWDYDWSATPVPGGCGCPSDARSGLRVGRGLLVSRGKTLQMA